MILVTDVFFPTKYGKWRIEEIKSFIDEREIDILVFKVEASGEIQFGVDYEYMRDFYGLDKFNILIFDPKYNYLNQYNTRIDGCSFNGKFPGSYLFTKKSDFNLSRYETIYHIFLGCYYLFNISYDFPKRNQFIHLYPGGGYNDKRSLFVVSKEVSFISTQPSLTEALLDGGFSNYIELLGATFLQKDSNYTSRTINNGTLNICFSSMVADVVKGTFAYIELAKQYKQLYPQDDVKFYSVGGCLSSEYIICYPLIPMNELEVFYDSIDIYINPEIESCGWPVGIEAMLRGCVLITTDVRKVNKHFHFTDDMILVVGVNDFSEFVAIIKKLYLDRNLLNNMSRKLQEYVNILFSFENQQKRIFDFIDSVKNK
jgi:glycosyltransferase involved in cell wall biosynthesis